MNALNYIILTAGLILIGLFWNIIAPKERAAETRKVTISMFFLGLIVYFVQSTFFPH